MQHHKFVPSNCMISEKYLKAKKIKDLGAYLDNKCVENKFSSIGGFIVMFDEENGKEIYYTKSMPIKGKDCKEESQKINTSSNDYLHEDIFGTYTGFIQGNMAGWMPISEIRIVEQLNFYDYKIDEFIHFFKSNSPTFHYKPS